MSLCTCACHHGAHSSCATQLACCATPEKSHDEPVICPFCKGLVPMLHAHVRECPSTSYLLERERLKLQNQIQTAHRVRREK